MALDGEPEEEITAKPSYTPEERFAWTSYLRIAAISAVVCIHTFAVLASSSAGDHRFARWSATVLDIGLIWCVPVIVMVSGALLLQPGRSASDFYKRRLSKVAIPLVFWHVFYIFYLRLENGVHLSFKQALTRIYTTNLASPLYFFWLILGLYAIAPVLQGFIAGASRRDLYIVTGLALAFNAGQQITVNLAAAYHLQNPPAGNIFTQWLPNVGYFLLGYTLRDVMLNRRQIQVATAVFAALTVEFVWQYRMTVDHSKPAGWELHLNQVLPVGYDGPLVMVASVCLFLLARTLLGPGTRWARPTTAGPLRRIGDLGLGVFGIHLAVIGIFSDRVLPKSSATWSGAPLSTQIIVCVVGIVGSFGIVWVIRRIPLVRRVV